MNRLMFFTKLNLSLTLFLFLLFSMRANAQSSQPTTQPAASAPTSQPVVKKETKEDAAPKSAPKKSSDDDDDDDDDWGDDEKKSSDDDDDDDEAKGPAYTIRGFVESASSIRVADDNAKSDHIILGEARFRLEARHENDLASLSFKGDFLADGYNDTISVDIREAVVAFRPFSWMDVKAGRQVLTWGTADLLFLNDLFPKDWVSFMSGREDEYLKAPSTSIKVSMYSGVANLDLIWNPVFQSDRYIMGERLSFFNPMANAFVGNDEWVGAIRPIDRKLKNGEFHGRLYKNISGIELALYGYLGFHKQPMAGYLMDSTDPMSVAPAFSRLGVYGASARGTLLGGIYNLETAFYHSLDDKDGNDPMTPNHQLRSIVGYEHELIAKMTLGVQYYNEFILQYDELEANSPNTAVEPDELRHVVTVRWMYRLLRDDLILGLFAFYSPSDKDFYLRPKIQYKMNDALKLTLGANVLWGDQDHTMFGMLRNNTNVYARARYTF